jgi:hypothetical protein
MKETLFSAPIGPVASERQVTKKPPEYHEHFSVDVILPPGMGPNGLESPSTFQVPTL